MQGQTRGRDEANNGAHSFLAFQGRSHTPARGTAAAGGSRARTSLPGTTENTPDSAPSAASSARVLFRARIT